MSGGPGLGTGAPNSKSPKREAWTSIRDESRSRRPWCEWEAGGHSGRAVCSVINKSRGRRWRCLAGLRTLLSRRTSGRPPGEWQSLSPGSSSTLPEGRDREVPAGDGLHDTQTARLSCQPPTWSSPRVRVVLCRTVLSSTLFAVVLTASSATFRWSEITPRLCDSRQLLS